MLNLRQPKGHRFIIAYMFQLYSRTSLVVLWIWNNIYIFELKTPPLTLLRLYHYT